MPQGMQFIFPRNPSALLKDGPQRKAEIPEMDDFRHHWRLAAAWAATAHQLHVVAKVLQLASLILIVLFVLSHMPDFGRVWWCGALVLSAVLVGVAAYYWRRQSAALRRVFSVGIAIFIGATIPLSNIGLIAISILCALAADYRRPERSVLARDIDRQLTKPSITLVAVDMLPCAPFMTDNPESAFLRRLYQDAGAALRKLNPRRLLRAADLRRQWAAAILLLLAATWVGNLTRSAAPPRFNHPARPGAARAQATLPVPATAHHGNASPVTPATLVKAQPTAATPGRHASLTGPGSKLRRGELLHNARQIENMKHIVSSRPLARPGSGISRRRADQILRALKALKPLGPERPVAAALEHKLAAGDRGRMGPSVQAIEASLHQLAHINQSLSAALTLPLSGSQERRSDHLAPGKSHLVSSGQRLGPAALPTGLKRTGAASSPLIPLSPQQVGRNSTVEHAMPGVRVYSFPGSPAAVERPNAALLRAVARLSAVEEGYVPRRYREAVRRYFSSHRTPR